MDKTTIFDLLEVGDMWQASEELMQALMNKNRREVLFREFLSVDKDLGCDWFAKMYNDEMGEKTNKKQYFTPPSVASLLTCLLSNDNNIGTNFDTGAGTGALTIAKWDRDRRATSPLIYRPSHYWYVCEELKNESQPSRALPFLLFNFLIRGMNGIVISGDALERKISQIYFIQNDKDDFLGFSSLNVLPRNQSVEKEFNVRKWIDRPIKHVESYNIAPTFLAKNIIKEK